MTAKCPTCYHCIPIHDADHGSWLLCPQCEGRVPVKRSWQFTRQAPPQRPRERWLGQILAVIGGFGFLLLGCSGLIGYAFYDHVTEPDFITYTSTDGHFRLDFPGKPYRAKPTTGSVSLDAVILERTVPDEAYMIGWVDLPKERMAHGADAILDEACNGASQYNAAMAEELSRITIACSGYPGRETVFSMKGKPGKGLMRVVLTRQRLFLLFVAGNFIQTDTTRARHFFDSFKID